MVYVLKMLLEKYVDRLQEGAGCERRRWCKCSSSGRAASTIATRQMIRARN